MTDSAPVHAPMGPYRVAIAELPRSTHLSHDPRGAIVVLPGSIAWPEALSSAVAAGAAAVVIVDPVVTPGIDMRGLARELTVPVIVDRPRLRADEVLRARAPRRAAGTAGRPNVVTAECEASAEQLSTILRDVVGWLRVVGETVVTVRSVQAGEAGAGLALLEGAGDPGLAMPLRWTEGGPAADGWIRVTALGELRTEIVVDGFRVTVANDSADGRTVAPRGLEGSPRLALRRAIAALAAGEQPTDLGELAADAGVARRILSPGP